MVPSTAQADLGHWSPMELMPSFRKSYRGLLIRQQDRRVLDQSTTAAYHANAGYPFRP
jgi:hypothetical protein